jgi:ATP-binding cassette subfamily B protein
MNNPPTENKKTNYWSTFRQLLKLVWKASPGFLVGLLAITVLLGLFPLATMLVGAALLNWLTQNIASQAGLPTQLLILLGLMGILRLSSNLFQEIYGMMQQLYQTRVINYIRDLIAQKVSTLDLEHFENAEFHNWVMTSVSQASYRPLMIVQQYMQSVSMLITLISVTTVLLVWQLWIIPAIVACSLLVFSVETYLGRIDFQRILKRTPEERRMQYMWVLLTMDSAAKEIRLFGLADHLIAGFRSIMTWLYEDDKRFLKRRLWLSSIGQAIISVMQPVWFGIAAYQVVQGSISIGQFSLYTQSAQQFQDTFTNLMINLGRFYENNQFMENLFRLLDMQAVVEAPRLESAAVKTSIAATPRIEFRNVTFQYPGTSALVLHDFCLSISPGESVALVGANGAGKTTVVKLLTGLYQPTSGQILLDGVDIERLDRRDLRSFMSVIFQDYTIYHFSAYDNIAFGDVAHLQDRERVFEAARLSGFDKVVEELPYGYDTVMERFYERGLELSGGQRQLVALSRALMRKAPILILDEPSAALDINKEMYFFETLLKNQKQIQQTVFFISHRSTTVQQADRIVVIEKGVILEQGSHGQLMARQGRYAEMFNLQMARYSMKGGEA